MAVVKRSAKVTNLHYSKLMVIKMAATESIEEYVFRADNSISILQSAKSQFDMVTVVRAIISGLHPHFASMAAPLLFADSVKTVTTMRDGFESLNIMGHVPRPVEYGNAALDMSIEVDNAYKNYNCHLCGHMGHISRNCPGPPTHPPLPRTNERSNGRNNQRGRGGGYRNNGGRGGQFNSGNAGRLNSGHGGHGGTRPETTLSSDVGERNWAAAARERAQFTPEKIQSARDIMILQGYKVTEALESKRAAMGLKPITLPQ